MRLILAMVQLNHHLHRTMNDTCTVAGKGQVSSASGNSTEMSLTVPGSDRLPTFTTPPLGRSCTPSVGPPAVWGLGLAAKLSRAQPDAEHPQIGG